VLSYHRNAPTRIVPPTLLLWGEKDRFLEHRVARAALSLCDNARLVIVPGTTHWLHLEEPARVNEEIAGFLAP
jgi:pimeloyl-ACP methyl ester carboxylesterase